MRDIEDIHIEGVPINVRFRYAEENEVRGVTGERQLSQEAVVRELEDGLEFLCVSGVEDRLRDGVPSSISNFREAGIKVWMLTGDKKETAKCVSICTGFKSELQTFYELTSADRDTLKSQLGALIGPKSQPDSERNLESPIGRVSNMENHFVLKGTPSDRDSPTEASQLARVDPSGVCLVITGDALETILAENDLRTEFLEKAPLCPSVVLCRCAPKQKTSVTEILKKKLKKVVCSVGDGGNDVGMIQASSFGIGIEGLEGRQAALASDISVREFSHIQSLLFWHGRLSYLRSAQICNFVVHRGTIVTIIQALFILIYYFVSISIYNGLALLGYSTAFTTFPIFMLILDSDLPRSQALNYPILYKYLHNGRYLNHKSFFAWLFQSIFQGALVLYVAIFFYHKLTFSKIVTTTFTALLLIGIVFVYLDLDL